MLHLQCHTQTHQVLTMKVLAQAYPYRYCESDEGDSGWIDKFSMKTREYVRMYDCDCPLQLMTAIEDYQYTLWLDPSGVACYRSNRGDVVKSNHD